MDENTLNNTISKFNLIRLIRSGLFQKFLATTSDIKYDNINNPSTSANLILNAHRSTAC